MKIDVMGCTGSPDMSFFQDLLEYRSVISWLAAIKRNAAKCELQRCMIITSCGDMEVISQSSEDTCKINKVIRYAYLLRDYYDGTFGEGSFDRKYNVVPNDTLEILYHVTGAYLCFDPKYNAAVEEICQTVSKEESNKILHDLRSIFSNM